MATTTTESVMTFGSGTVTSFQGGLSEAALQQIVEKVEKVALPKAKPRINFDSVVLAEEKKEEIQAAISQIKNKDMIFDTWGFGEIFEKGTAITLLFYGIPGTGKTLMAQAISDKLGADLKVYGAGEIQSSEPGGAERTIKKIFEAAVSFLKEYKKPRVILFDECDSLLYDRNKVGVILGAQINALLTEIERHDGIIIFTTNRMGKLDPALERRIAAKIEFPFPKRAERVAIWHRMIPQKAPLDPKMDWEELATFPLAGGSIKNVVLNAARMAAYKNEKYISMQHFLDAIEKESAAAQAFSDEAEEDNFSGFDMDMHDDNKLVLGENNLIKKKPKYKAKSINKEGE